MFDRISLILSFGGIVASVYTLAITTTPRRGWLKCAEKLAGGTVICALCYAFLQSFGIKAALTPFSSGCAGWLGIPGAVFSAFLTLYP